MIKLIKSAKFKKTISFTIAILLIGFAIYITTLDYDYFLGIGCSVFIIAGILLIIEAINITETKPKIQTEALDEDALWRVVCEHIIDCMFSDKVIHILESEFIIKRVDSSIEESQSKLWEDVLDYISNQKYFGNTINELKSKFTIKNK